MSGWGLWQIASLWQYFAWLQEYNTRVVVFGTAILGAVCGVVGTFTLLRKRALLGDALSHATLPGIVLAFLLAPVVGVADKSLSWLLLGATITGVMGILTIQLLVHFTRLKEETAMGLVLSLFFGAGVSLLVLAEHSAGNAAGLEGFIYGKTASMIAFDAWLIAGAAIVCGVLVFLFLKELTLLCFDEDFARFSRLPVFVLDLLLMALLTILTIVGLQAVGLILIVSLLIIPAASARFWTNRIQVMIPISAILGGMGGAIGSVLSAIFPNLPSGATIVLVLAFGFFVSLFFGRAHGVITRWRERRAFLNSLNHPVQTSASANLTQG